METLGGGADTRAEERCGIAIELSIKSSPKGTVRCPSENVIQMVDPGSGSSGEHVDIVVCMSKSLIKCFS